MQSIDLIRDNLGKSEARVLARIEDMRERCLVTPTAQGGGHTLWVLGHLAYIEALVREAFLRGVANPLSAWEPIFDGADVPGDAGVFPTFDEVLEACREQRRTTLALLDTLTEQDLDRPSPGAPAGQEENFGTLRVGFQFIADHGYMHRGQLAGARRAAGVGRMWF